MQKPSLICGGTKSVKKLTLNRPSLVSSTTKADSNRLKITDQKENKPKTLTTEELEYNKVMKRKVEVKEMMKRVQKYYEKVKNKKTDSELLEMKS